MASRKEVLRNIPFLVLRWPVIESKLKYLPKFNIHPLFTYPFKNKFVSIPIDFKSSWIAKDSCEPNTVYSQLISEHRSSTEEINIFTDGSRTLKKDGSCRVGCAVFVPGMDITHKLKLNAMTSSYMAKVFAIDKILDMCKNGILP